MYFTTDGTTFTSPAHRLAPEALLSSSSFSSSLHLEVFPSHSYRTGAFEIMRTDKKLTTPTELMAVFEGVNFFLAEKLVKDATQVCWIHRSLTRRALGRHLEVFSVPLRPHFCLVLQLKSLLVGGGGTREFYPSELVSHVIADSLPPPSLGLARCSGSLMLHVSYIQLYTCTCSHVRGLKLSCSSKLHVAT